MDLLRLLLVDDEKIILKGLKDTYDWESMGYQVVGTAESGEKALALLEDEEPDVVITDIRMKKVSGLELIEKSKLTRPGIKFIIVSAYKDFEYAKKACEEGALSYLVKPIDDDELESAMGKAYRMCMEERQTEHEHESWKKILAEDRKKFLGQMIERYVKEEITEQELRMLAGNMSVNPRSTPYYCCIYADIDGTCKITNQLDFDAKRYLLFGQMETQIRSRYEMWQYRGGDGCGIFLVKLCAATDTAVLKEMMGTLKTEYQETVVSAISNAYAGFGGLKTAYQQGRKLYEIACEAGAGLLIISKDTNVPVHARYFEDIENQIVRALRKNAKDQLREGFEKMVYQLPSEEKTAKTYLHRLAVMAEIMLDDSYGISENIRLGFANFYEMIQPYTLLRLIDLLYKLLCVVIEERVLEMPAMAEEYFSEYMEAALQYVHEHFHEEDLSITIVADKVFLNPVYFGRLFKNVMGMTFKKYVLNERMERAKKMILETSDSIAEIGGNVGIPNPSYFSQLFKQATGKLPSEYKKEHNL